MSRQSRRKRGLKRKQGDAEKREGRKNKGEKGDQKRPSNLMYGTCSATKLREKKAGRKKILFLA